eukprot:NODE_1835_length_414_cov_110.331010_g1825_i0.p1 GENE.NODE_1835_length_414_cov_110.331010_g1825_i0~~NODE_1835_length_414_cov_110.331010_g1825_i0.p1  ORF type:complete len:55 (-),score=9.60 NODE_1835_length_414_cov_110.331010_g1825_i0:123-287(-)
MNNAGGMWRASACPFSVWKEEDSMQCGGAVEGAVFPKRIGKPSAAKKEGLQNVH